MDFLKGLNREQYLAASTLDGALLIIAGAGSGKTRVITHRIATMLQNGIAQNHILALTFTNKAAREMEERIHDLVKKKLRSLTVSTFHAFGVNILKKHIHHLGYRPNFTIYDDGDQQGLIRECARELGIQTDEIEYAKVMGTISKIKSRRIKIGAVEDKSVREIYAEYQERLKLFNAVDFDDLILLPLRLLEEFPEVKAEYQKQFRYVMVDEFQDTSLLQYEFMRHIASGSRNICVVGDDDQSIYSWRGANFENIRMFERDFPELLEIKLEQNYRSTGTILEAANKLIVNNKNRKEKALWTPSGSGNAIELYHLQNEMEEAFFIVKTIKSIAFDSDLKYDEFGVLLRTNALSRHLEEAFMAENLPYRLTGGTSFFSRPEIKDMLCYLRLFANPDDDISLLRIINTPRRNIGKKTIETLSKAAIRHRTSMVKVLASAVKLQSDEQDDLFSESPVRKGAGDAFWSQMGLDPLPHEKANFDEPQKGNSFFEHLPQLSPSEANLGGQAIGALSELLRLIEAYRPKILSGKDLARHTRQLVHDLDYWGYLLAEYPENEKIAQWRHRNIELLCQSLERYETDPDNHPPSIFTYLNRVTLNSNEQDDEEDSRGKINLMTIHASKGLEFKVVFLAGVEDGIIPHKRSLTENEEGDYEANMEEERRLFYVAITRAREKLIMTSAQTRTQMRQSMAQSLSPFLSEIPAELITMKDGHEEKDEALTEDKSENFFKNLQSKYKPITEDQPE